MMMRELFLADMEIVMTPKNISNPSFTKEQIEAAIAAAPEYVYDPDSPYNPNNEEEVKAYLSSGIVTYPGGHPHQDPLWRIHGKRHAVKLSKELEA
ncbi:hypothetical protein FHW83_000820 [Duganella sp. SG902]|uniref:hypothetical protein n=1 Tax=Duganella sp. SG902 TaxID=2587016 RepID=UPI00159E3DC3|nr:hypothetical protein [Duganella sp. SG902]NVM75040.1 hypothetical protein [Duganella sp. SG902]